MTDRRRWESALFLQVRDEIQTGNLAIDGAKNFGRFEAFFLPAERWEQVREAFWARTRFPVDPAAAVEQLKARLSDAFDRFLEGVADNRQVAFDDDGWRLKTDAAEQPDPAQSDRLAELHRWLDASRRARPTRSRDSRSRSRWRSRRRPGARRARCDHRSSSRSWSGRCSPSGSGRSPTPPLPKCCLTVGTDMPYTPLLRSVHGL